MAFYLPFLLQNNASIDHQGTHDVCWIPAKVFNQLPVRRWKYNRPCDADRVAEIHEYMKTSNRMDGVIYLACIGNELVCYESNHRREAIKGLDTLHNVLIDIIWDATDEMVKSEFIRLNKAVSVPELYIGDATPTIVNEVRTIVDDFCKNYKKLKVNSGRPQRPNFNRDMVTDEFVRVMREKNLTPTEFADWITQRNTELSRKERSGLTEKVISKCEDSGLWLFAWSGKMD
jgi:hypothetical protein